MGSEGWRSLTNVSNLSHAEIFKKMTSSKQVAYSFWLASLLSSVRCFFEWLHFLKANLVYGPTGEILSSCRDQVWSSEPQQGLTHLSKMTILFFPFLETLATVFLEVVGFSGSATWPKIIHDKILWISQQQCLQIIIFLSMLSLNPKERFC